jgi:sigma-B regulation protein RsbU (phosphoserine phosphatase)
MKNSALTGAARSVTGAVRGLADSLLERHGRYAPALEAIAGVEFPDPRLQLPPGDRLVLYTEGVTEAFNSAHEAYGTERLIAEVRAAGDGAAAALVERICWSVSAFGGGAAQADDITLTVLAWRAQ